MGLALAVVAVDGVDQVGVGAAEEVVVVEVVEEAVLDGLLV